MEREKGKRKKRKSVENEKTNSKESKHKDTKQKRENKVRRKTIEKLRESLFFEVIFIEQKILRLRQKNPDIFQKRMWKQRKIAKCFWRSCVKKTNSKAKIDESQEKQFFFLIKRVSMIFFETFVQKQNDNLFF